MMLSTMKNDGEVKEYYEMTGRRISGGASCVMIKSKWVKLPEGIMAI